MLSEGEIQRAKTLQISGRSYAAIAKLIGRDAATIRKAIRPATTKPRGRHAMGVADADR